MQPVSGSSPITGDEPGRPEGPRDTAKGEALDIPMPVVDKP